MKKGGQDVRWYKSYPQSRNHHHQWWRRLAVVLTVSLADYYFPSISSTLSRRRVLFMATLAALLASVVDLRM